MNRTIIAIEPNSDHPGKTLWLGLYPETTGLEIRVFTEDPKRLEAFDDRGAAGVFIENYNNRCQIVIYDQLNGANGDPHYVASREQGLVDTEHGARTMDWPAEHRSAPIVLLGDPYGAPEAEQEFEVTVGRIAYRYKTFQVKAKSLMEAQDIAMRQAADTEFSAPEKSSDYFIA